MSADLLGIRFCPTCQEDTIPHDETGMCLFCDTQIADAKKPTAPTKPESTRKTRLAGCVYGLCDPESGELRYIGITRQKPAQRLKQHIAEANATAYRYRPVCQWIRTLNGRPPALSVMDECDTVEDLAATERRLIDGARAIGVNLLNAAPGGEGAYSGIRARAEMIHHYAKTHDRDALQRWFGYTEAELNRVLGRPEPDFEYEINPDDWDAPEWARDAV